MNEQNLPQNPGGAESPESTPVRSDGAIDSGSASLGSTPNAVPADRLGDNPLPAKAARPESAEESGAAPTLSAPEVDESSLEEEIQNALGDVNLMDIYQLDEAEQAQKASAKSDKKKSDKTAQGICRGKVLSISGDDIFVDLGGKSQGVLPKTELEEDEKVEIGQELDVVIARYDARDGLLILSKKTADQRLVWGNLDEGSLVEALVTGTNKGGLELEMKGIKMFMPASQISTYRVEDFEQFVNQKMVCEVTQVERGEKNVIVSRRNVLEREEESKREQLWEELAEGQKRHGVVRSIMDYGAFVDLGGADGLLHVREMSWARVKHPSEILSDGQNIEVVVTKVDKENRKIGLSLKQASGDPWIAAEQKYTVGSRHIAQVTNLMDFGAFAELESGLDGLIPISEMTWAGRVRHPSDVVQVGAQVEVEMIKVDRENRKISMSIKKVQSNPWQNISQRYQKDQIVEGTVARITDFGAFVSLEDGVDGLIHISELSDKRVAQVADVVQEGQTVTVKILSVDEGQGKISLSMKSLIEAVVSETPAAGDSEASTSDTAKKKKDRPRRGGLGWDDNSSSGLSLGS
jgi:small subunit ribosomal protein S1